MELLLISRCPPYPLYHGDRLIPHHLTRMLASRQHLIDLIAFYQQPEDLADVPLYERTFRSVQLIPEPRRSWRSYWDRHRHPEKRFPTTAEASWSPAMWQAVERSLQEKTYDLVHLFGGVQVYEYLELVRLLPNIIVPYESYSLWLERALNQPQPRLTRRLNRLKHRVACSYEGWMFDQYDRVVVLTDRDARALRELNPRNATVTIPNGVDLNYFTPTGYEPSEPAILFIGNYDYAPNHDAALRLLRDVFPRIVEIIPEARLLLVGSHPSAEMRSFASEQVEITGRVADIRPYYEYAKLFLSPLRLGAGIKNKILEALAMATPIVATPLSCDGIPVTSGTHVLLSDTDDELAIAAIQVLRNKPLRRQLRINGRRLVERHFTWPRVAARYEDLYRRTIDEREHDIYNRYSQGAADSILTPPQ